MKYLLTILISLFVICCSNSEPTHPTELPSTIVEEVEKMGMFDILEKLQVHENQVIYEKTILLILLMGNILINLLHCYVK